MSYDGILFIDGEAIVIDKPAGLAVHPGPKTPRSLEDYLRDLRFGFRREPAPVHRLDRDTSGCLLLARNPKALKKFQAAFEARIVEKSYLAVLQGHPDGEEGVIDMPLLKESSAERGWRMVVRPGGQASRTQWKVLTRIGERSLVLFKPETGRTHQIRAHAAYGLGAAVTGDPIYGRAGEPMMLHAIALAIPREGKPPVSALAPLPRHFQAWTEHLPAELRASVSSEPVPDDAA